MMLEYQASFSETSCDFFFCLIFFFIIQPTDPISGNAFDGKRKKRDGRSIHALKNVHYIQLYRFCYNRFKM